MSKIIHLLDKAVALQQPEGGFQTSIDAVLLAAACPVKAGQSVLDMGCGVGAAGLCVLQRAPDAELTGLEILAREADLARDNIQRNQRQGTIVQADVNQWDTDDRFDHIITNPPYLDAGHHLHSDDTAKAQAMGYVDTDMSLTQWVKAAHRLLKSRGSLTIVHRAEALGEIITALGKRFGAIEVIPLWPKETRTAKRVIVRAIKDRKSGTQIHPGLVLHCENGDYTDQAESILRRGAGLYLD